ncbi:MAG: response regulator [Fimbriimonadaceae bacterium]|nr:response regulator [Fimbriimonadaceae bacterium]
MENKVVLLIEDNPDDERLTLRALRRNNIMNEVVVATDGEEAVKFLFGEQPPDPVPALIILDLRLPGLTGLDLLRRLREEPLTALVPVVVLTANADRDSRVRAYELGANSFLIKPTDPGEYAEAVLQIGMYWLLLNELPYE